MRQEEGCEAWEHRNLVLLEPQENSDVGSVLRISFRHLILDEMDGLVRPKCPSSQASGEVEPNPLDYPVGPCLPDSQALQ